MLLYMEEKFLYITHITGYISCDDRYELFHSIDSDIMIRFKYASIMSDLVNYN